MQSLAHRMAALLLSAFFAFAPRLTEAQGKSIPEGKILVNQRAIPAEEVRLAREDLQSAGWPDSPEVRQQAREQLIARELFAQESRKADLIKEADVITRTRMVREEVLARRYQTHYLSRNPVSEAEAEAAYASLKERSGSTEYQVRQMFLLAESDAAAAIKRLDAGEKFSAVAMQLSKDDATRANGGDLGWLTPVRLMPHMVAPVTTLKKGDYTRAPVKGINGWHVVMVEDTRPFTLAPYAQLAPQLKRELAQVKLQKHLGELRAQAKIQ